MKVSRTAHRVSACVIAAVLCAGIAPATSFANGSSPAPATVTAPVLPGVYAQDVSAPFFAHASLRVRDGKRVTRVSAEVVTERSIRLTSSRPTRVELRIVRAPGAAGPQNDRRVVRVTPGGRVVAGLAPGRTYLVRPVGGKVSARITPMKAVNAVGGIDARFTDVPVRANADAGHTNEWARGDKNVQYWWKVTQYRPLTAKRVTPTGRGLSPQYQIEVADREMFATSTSAPSSTLTLPDSGHVKIDVIAVNPINTTEVATFYTSVPLEQAWAAQGPGGSLLLSTTPAPAIVQAQADQTRAENAENARYFSVVSSAEAGAAADAAKRAAGAAKAAMEMFRPDEASAQARIAHEQAARARAAAIEADTYKNQIPGDTFREARLEAEEAVRAAQRAADEAEFAAAQASWHAAEAWRVEAIRALNELTNGHGTLSGQAAVDFADRTAARAAYAAQMAAAERDRINVTKYPDMAMDAAADAAEAAEAALAAEAMRQMVRAREGATWTAVDALTPAAAIAFAADARAAAIAARVAADTAAAQTTYPGDVYDNGAAASATEAEMHATEAEAARDDVIHRDAAQQYQRQAEELLDAASQTLTAEEARVILEQARTAATNAENEAASVRDSSDEKDAANAAAAAARAAALAVEQYSHADQSLLDEPISIDGSSLQVALGGATSITFAKNPNDTRAAVEYRIEAVNRDNGAILAGTQVDNGDGTITVTWGSLPVSDAGYTFRVTPTSYNEERVSNAPSEYSPAALTPTLLSGLLGMPVSSSMEVCGETPKAIGTLVGDECVATRALAYDTAPLEYNLRWDSWQERMTVGYTNVESPDQPGRIIQQWSCPSGWTARGDQAEPGLCTRTVSGWVTDFNSPKAQPSRAARIDSFFTDTTWNRTSSNYVAKSPLPAGDFNTALHTYNYEADRNLYVTRNIPAISQTFAPLFDSLPNGVIAWTATSTTGSAATHTGLQGQDTGRFTPTVTVHTVGGSVQVPAPTVNGVAADR